MHSGKRQGECSHGFHQLGWDRWGIIRQGGFDKKKCSNWQLATANSTWPMPCSAAFVLPRWVGMPECRWSLGAVRCFPSTNSLLVTSVKSNCFNTKSTFWGLNQYDYHEIPICAGSILIVAGEITIFAAYQVKVPLVAGETTIFTMTSPRWIPSFRSQAAEAWESKEPFRGCGKHGEQNVNAVCWHFITFLHMWNELIFMYFFMIHDDTWWYMLYFQNG